MRKNQGKSQQVRGAKRNKKVLVRKNNKQKHENFITNLMSKYKNDFDINKLKPLYQPGQIYWNLLLNDNQTENLEKENNNA